MKQNLVYTIIFTFIFCFLFVFILAFVNQSTGALVALNQKLLYKRAILGATGIPFSSDEEVVQRYELITPLAVDGEEIYTTTINNNSVYAKRFSGAGLWGTITGVLAVNEDVSEIVGLRIISHNETPGLGGRIEEDWFTNQLTGETIDNYAIAIGRAQSGDLGDSDKTNAQIDAITGATRTSDAIRVILNAELLQLVELIGGVQ